MLYIVLYTQSTTTPYSTKLCTGEEKKLCIIILDKASTIQALVAGRPAGWLAAAGNAFQPVESKPASAYGRWFVCLREKVQIPWTYSGPPALQKADVAASRFAYLCLWACRAYLSAALPACIAVPPLAKKKKGCGFRYDQGTEKHRAKGLVEWKDRLVSYTHMVHLRLLLGNLIGHDNIVLLLLYYYIVL